MIRLTLIGNIGNDCLINDVNGRRVCNFQVAHTEKFKDHQGNEIQKTIWVSCAYWNEKNSVVQYLKKGVAVYVEGIPDIKMYKNSQGENKANITLRVSQIQLLGGGNREQSLANIQQQSTPSQGYQPASDINSTEEDFELPF